jgi:predicted aminopeptidase
MCRELAELAKARSLKTQSRSELALPDGQGYVMYMVFGMWYCIV